MMTAKDYFNEMRSDPRNESMPDETLWRHAELRASGKGLRQRMNKPQRSDPGDGQVKSMASLADLAERLMKRVEDMPDDEPEQAPDPNPAPTRASKLRHPSDSAISGCFEPELIERCRLHGWGGYNLENFPGGANGLRRLQARLAEWAAVPKQTQFVFITGLHARGKTYLQTLLMYRMLCAHAASSPPWHGRWTRASELQLQLQNWRSDQCGYNYGEDRPLTPVETWLQRAPRVIGIDEIDKPSVEFNRSDNWVRIWLELLTQLKESKRSRFVVICSNIKSRDFAAWERSLPGQKLNQSTPIASRLTAHDVLQIELSGDDGGRDFRANPWSPEAGA